MNERVFQREAVSSPPSLHSRHSSVSNDSASTSTSTSTSSNLSISALEDELSTEDPADFSPLRQVPIEATANGAGTASLSMRERQQSGGYSTATLGLRSFSQQGSVTGRKSPLSPAQRLAKESLPSPPATSRGEGESERGSMGSGNSANLVAALERSSSTMTNGTARYSQLDTQISTEGMVNALEAANGLEETASVSMQSPLEHSTTSFATGSTSLVNIVPAARRSRTGLRTRSRIGVDDSNSILETDAQSGRASTSLQRSRTRLSPDRIGEDDDADISGTIASLDNVYLARRESVDLISSQNESLRSEEKGKSRESSPLNRKGMSRLGNPASSSVEKIRRASAATRQRVSDCPSRLLLAPRL